ncbi:hypothetical protein OG689_06095 [Kitasatospora sp. NBC_00240]|uniref:hypothetical protein n=1 Tax=Kitasatospora sp. NBC_00240 TaxID=2903567 RepID=UPI002251FD5E|nr:hypothetical protein [Kitasatospora sp. NBC_00240]MCX5208867.1 hypothetical protein [Kitasatospora sp. NBC_00240]
MSFSSGPFVPRAEHHLSLPGTAYADRPTRRASPDGCSPWIVTLHIRHSDGRAGTHSFVEWALTSPQAIASALRRASTPAARRHRRDAVVEAGATAVAEFWQDFRSPAHPAEPCAAVQGGLPHPRPAAVGGAARDHGDPRRYWAGGANVYALYARAGSWAEPGGPGGKGAPGEPGAVRSTRGTVGPIAHC